MKISAKTAIRKIKAGTAWVEGKMSTGHTYPEGDEYWIITDSATMTTCHVLASDAPNLDQVKNQAAAAMGRKGGRVKSDAKAAAAKANGARGGRPKRRKTI